VRVLIAGLGDNKEFGLASLRNAGHFVGVIDLPHRIPINQCDWWRAGDRFSVDSMLAVARSADFTWDAVLCWEELSTDLAREVAAKLDVPATRMPPGHFRNKGAMHRALREHGLPTPQLGVATTLVDCETLAAGAFPVVVKPTDYGGSGGVRVVDDPAELAEAFEAAARTSAGGEVAVDRYVVGTEYSVEAVTWAPGKTEVIAVTEKHLTRPPFCVEVGHVLPATVSGEDYARLEQATIRTLDALGMEAGVCHAEFRMSPDGPMLMEVAGRPAGDQIPRLVELTTGWNLYTAELAAVVGSTTAPEAPAAECAAIRFFVGDGSTPFRYPVTLENAMVAPLSTVLYELRYGAGEGTVLAVPRGPDGRAGYALLAGSTEDVTAAMTILNDGAEVYRGE
jgi:biotin carboxylase